MKTRRINHEADTTWGGPTKDAEDDPMPGDETWRQSRRHLDEGRTLTTMTAMMAAIMTATLAQRVRPTLQAAAHRTRRECVPLADVLACARRELTPWRHSSRSRTSRNPPRT